MKSAILYTYSSGSVLPFKELVQSMLDIMRSSLIPEDLFYYAIFCPVSQYTNVYANIEINDIPAILISERTPYSEQEAFVTNIMNQVIKCEIPKPQWMIDVEQSDRCGNNCCAPSTKLCLIPKSEEYKELGEKIISFLYSPGHEISYQ